MKQERRTEVFHAYCLRPKACVLFCTDVASRGLGRRELWICMRGTDPAVFCGFEEQPGNGWATFIELSHSLWSAQCQLTELRLGKHHNVGRVGGGMHSPGGQMHSRLEPLFPPAIDFPAVDWVLQLHRAIA